MRFVCLAIVLLVVAPATAAEATLLTGRKVAGNLVAVAPDAVSIQEPGAVTPTRLDVKELAAVDLGKPARPMQTNFDEVELTDGSVLRMTQLLLPGKRVVPTPLTPAAAVATPNFDIPLGAVFTYFRSAEDAAARADWQKLVDARGKRDLFVVRLSNGLNPLSGTLVSGNEAGDAVTFEREDSRKVTLKLTRASGGIVLNQPPRDQLPPTLCKLTDAFGNTLVVTRLELAAGALKATTVSGATVTYPELAAVAKLDFRQGNITYLSDLEGTPDYPPAEADGVLGEAFPYRRTLARDKSLDGGNITLDGVTFARGVSLPAGAAVTYTLGGDARQFKATVGLQDGNNRESWQLRLRVEIDGRNAFDEVIRKADKPRDIVLSVKDARQVRVVCERVGLFAGDQLNLGDARLQK
jgi:hypothetical protein